MRDIPDTWKDRIKAELRRVGVEDKTEWALMPSNSHEVMVRLVLRTDSGVGTVVDIDVPKGMETRRFDQKMSEAAALLEEHYLRYGFFS